MDGRSFVADTNILFFRLFGRSAAAGVAASRAARLRLAARLAARFVARARPSAAPRRSSRRRSGGWGAVAARRDRALHVRWAVRTVDEQAERDGVDDDQHGHGGLALALGAFGAGIMDEFFLGASEKGTHGEGGGIGRRVRRGMDVRQKRDNYLWWSCASFGKKGKKEYFWLSMSASNQSRSSSNRERNATQKISSCKLASRACASLPQRGKSDSFYPEIRRGKIPSSDLGERWNIGMNNKPDAVSSTRGRGSVSKQTRFVVSEIIFEGTDKPRSVFQPETAPSSWPSIGGPSRHSHALRYLKHTQLHVKMAAIMNISAAAKVVKAPKVREAPSRRPRRPAPGRPRRFSGARNRRRTASAG